MLVLARLPGEAVTITAGDQVIRLTVIDIAKKKLHGEPRVRLGFDADRSVTIHREEIQRLVDERAEDAQQ